MDIHWRNTQKPARLWMLDARAAIIVLFCMLYPRYWTLFLTFVVIMIFFLMERRGLTFDASLRAFRCWLLGGRRPATHRRSRRHLIDYG